MIVHLEIVINHISTHPSKKKSFMLMNENKVICDNVRYCLLTIVQLIALEHFS